MEAFEKLRTDFDTRQSVHWNYFPLSPDIPGADTISPTPWRPTMRNKRLIAGVVIVLGALAWYAFRPERLFIDSTVNESLAAATPSTLAQGVFHSNAHETTGNATILSLPDGRRVLRLTNFSTSNGPDVRVYLVAASDVTDDETVKTAGFVELGPMKGNRGDQNYEVPASVDLAAYRTVTIWCKRFSVNFGSAPLSAS
jgi:hypothetical protein